MMITLRPSAAKFWTACAVYPKMVAALPEQPESDPAREGTCAAWVAERIIRGEAVAVGDQHRNGWVVDADMLRLMHRYREILWRYGLRYLEAERFVRLNEMIAGTTDAWGILTADDAGANHLVVIDLKYGYGIVEPAFNPQLSCYGGALVREAQRAGVTIASVTLVIHQPRAVHPDGHTRHWTTDTRSFMGHVAEIEKRGAMCQAPDPIASAGPHCNDCPAAATCYALGRSLYQAHGTALLSQQRQMTRDELAAELVFLTDAEKMFKARRSMVEAEAAAHIERGEVIPGWTLEAGTGNRRWTVPASQIHALTLVDPRSDKLATPAELIRRGADEAVVNMLTETPRTAPTLRRFDPRKVGKVFQ